MITLYMSQKDNPVIITEGAFSTETGVLTLEISLDTYSLTGKTITAVFSQTVVETAPLTVSNGLIYLPITLGLLVAGENKIQLNIREGLTLEQSPIMKWAVGLAVAGTEPAPTDVDIITELLAEASDIVDVQMPAFVVELEERIDAIITTPAEGVSAQEIIDARNGEATLGGRFNGIDSQLADGATYMSSFPRINGETDDTARMQRARDYLAGQSPKKTLIFNAGIYIYSVSPNWAMQDARIAADGEVRLRYIGVGNAVIIDGGNTGGIYNFHMGRFIVDAPSTALNGCLVRAVHDSIIDIKVQGCGTNYSAIRVEWCVCTEFRVTSSVNQGWYLGAKPKNGLYLTKILGGITDSFPTSYCIFINPVIEGPDVGIVLNNAIGCGFFGGTSEGCATAGLQILPESYLNKFFNVDFEANTIYDIYCSGHDNAFYGCDTAKLLVLDTATSKSNHIIGGSHSVILLSAVTANNLVEGVRYSRWLNSDPLTDQGTGNRLVNNFNCSTNKYGNSSSANATTLTVTASPFTYINTSGNDQRILIQGGTLTGLLYHHGFTGDSLVGYDKQFITLCPGDSLDVTYTVLPTIRCYTV